MIPLSEIKAATNGFDEAHFVAGGGFGLVYKGELNVLGIPISSSIEGELQKERTKRSVAIKCIKNRQDVASKQGFLTEIELLTSCKHQNVISLLGLYMEADDIMLVYEYASKGSLSDCLRSTRTNINLTWGKRLEICLDIARGISYLHTSMEGKPRIIHRDIKSENILLDENLNAKIADFGLSKSHSTNQQQRSTIQTKHIVGTDFYVDPEYVTSGKYKKESDIYSFGVVLFEMLSGRLAYEQICTQENDKGLAPIARRRFSEKTLKELIDPKMIDDDGEHIVTLNKGPNQESFEAFSRIAYQCLAETQAKRPTMEAVIKELENCLNLQGETVVLSRFRLGDILLATDNFSETCCIGLHEYGKVYKAELDDFDNKSLLAFKEKSDSEWPKTWPKTRVNVAIKRISSSMDVEQSFFSEIERRTTCKHPNIVNVLGFCDEGDEIILVYEHASNKSLDYYLKTVDNMDNLTWTQRLHMCLGIARGLNHLHTKMDSQERLMHGNITSANILFGKNWEPKVAYFGISEFHLENQEASTLISTEVYRDPEFEKTLVMKKESDIYSLGVLMFEIFCGRLAYDPIYIDNSQKGLPHVARSHFNNGTIKILLDPKLKEVTNDDIFTSNMGPNQDSLDTFLNIAHQCLEEAQAMRPTMEMVIKELEMALNFQENLMKSLQISLEDIELATEKFSQKNYYGSGRYWKTYNGELQHASANTAIIVKRWDSMSDDQFRTELDILSKRKHKNIIGLVGYCNEMNEKIVVYEHMPKGSLDKFLEDSNLSWMKRLRICIYVTSALEFLHGGDVTLKKVVHRDIKSNGILLNDNWNAKISNFELSSLESSNQDMEHISDDAYLDPQYKQGFLTEKSDIYSLGVVLFEILCGRLAWVDGQEDNSQSLGSLAKHYYNQGKLDQMVFEDIKKQIVPQSLTTFADIAYQCLDEDDHMRPQASEVVIQLKKALEFQEDSEIWEPKLPRDYKEIIRLSGTSEIYNKKDIYVKLSEGIHLPKDKVWFKLSDNGELNKMISATAAKFSYKNRESHKCRSIHISRFWKVAKMLDISNLKIQVTTDNHFLSPDVIYGIYLIFKFSDPRKFPHKQRLYVNLKYKNGTDNLNSYFATWRDEEWMMIELHRFLNHKEGVSFTFLLESFSRYYCTNGTIYVEGIEFRAIKKASLKNTLLISSRL
ncbi:uncharacterized protein LOC143547637 [Bidens hawaiensis]|uniref:uncharacterized protein LOC143547637 n=1 Tax=Bidens hawaiensis TaxID=980011 RepID=UPI0040495862